MSSSFVDLLRSLLIERGVRVRMTLHVPMALSSFFLTGDETSLLGMKSDVAPSDESEFELWSPRGLIVLGLNSLA